MEQASRDPSLAIITDRITTPEELSKLYAKYRILPKKQKRYSNYYSNEFQGRRVSEMYVLMKDKFKPGGELSEAWQMPKDAFVVSEPDLYYKEESFNKGDTNICFILLQGREFQQRRYEHMLYPRSFGKRKIQDGKYAGGKRDRSYRA